MADEMNFFISEKFLSRLQRICGRNEADSFGFLHSFMIGVDQHIVSCSALSNQERNDQVYATVRQSLPGGITVCGLYVVTDQASNSTVVQTMCKALLQDAIEILSDESQVLLLAIDPHGPVDNMYLYEYSWEDNRLTNLSITSTQTDIMNSCMLVRLEATLQVNRELSQNKDKIENELQSPVEFWKEDMMCPSTAFHVQDSNLLLFYNENNPKSNYTCRDLISHIQKEDEDEFDRKKKQKMTDFSQEVIHLSLLRQTTGDVACQLSTPCAPLIHHNHGAFMQLTMCLPIDIVAYVHEDTSTEYLTDIMVESICQQLDAFCGVLANSKDGSVHTPVPYHFKPSRVGHMITVIYPHGATDKQLESRRKQLHSIYHLPEDIPQLKRLNAFIFPDEPMADGYLINPHVGLRPSGVTDGCVSMVTGQYAYHHYMQDRVDDNGWGCAYRSLQTLISWFRLQGYTDKPVPTHRDIQQALVDIRDKEVKFVGTKQWIGSTEVSFVLDHLLGIASKILYVSSGAEMEAKGRELAIHFDTQGTPVMIGGGVLAHTILGVDFNEVTGDVKFLILDPHYTGGENVKLIQDKGWCGWKGPDFWDKNAYYNMCMPQRPAMI